MEAPAPTPKPMDKKPPTSKREDPGLKLDGKGRWWVDCYINGQRVRRCVGKKSDAKEAMAKEKERGRLALLFPERAESAQAKKLTVADLVARFQPELEANCRSHKNPARSGKVAADFFGKKPVSRIKPEDIEAFKIHRLSTKISRTYKDKKKNANLPTLSPASVNRDLARLKTLFSKAVANGLMDSNPMTKKQVRMLPEEPDEAGWFTPETEALLGQHMPEKWFRLVQLGCLTGFRCGELFMLQRSKCMLEAGYIDLTKNKAKKPRHFHLGPRGLALLREILDSHDSEWVFPSRNLLRPISRRNFYGRVFEVARGKAGLPENLILYSMRHTYAVRCIQAGMDIHTLKEQMGHSSVTVTERYFKKHAPSHTKKMVQLYG